MLVPRGQIQHRERAQQLRDFSGLRYGNITPTDIDALIEYQDKCYVFIETKFVGADIPRGQFLALERLCDDLQKIKPVIAIIARHEFPVWEDIDLANCSVEKYRYNHIWIEWHGKVKTLVDEFLKKSDK